MPPTIRHPDFREPALATPSSRGSLPQSTAALALLAVMLPPLLWAGNFVVGRAIRHDITPGALVFIRHLLALLCLLPFCWRHMRRDAGAYWRQRWFLLRTSLTGMVLFNLLIYLGLQSTAATNALLFNSAIPVLIALLALVFFRERTSARQLLGLGVSLCGVLTIVSRGEWQALVQLQFSHGDLLVLAGVASFALYSIWLRDFPAGVHRISLVCMQMLVATVLLLPVFVWSLATQGFAPWSGATALGVAYVAVGSSVVATLCYAAAVRRFGPVQAGLSIHLTPLFGAFMSALFLGERVYRYHWLGMLLILGGLAYATWPRRAAPAPENAG